MNEAQAIDRMRQVTISNAELRMQNEEFKSGLNEDLERFGRMAFVRAADCTGVIRRFHELRRARPKSNAPRPKSEQRSSKQNRRPEHNDGDAVERVLTGRGNASVDVEEHPDYGLVEEVYRWMFWLG